MTGIATLFTLNKRVLYFPLLNLPTERLLARVVLVDDARVSREDLVSQLLLMDSDVGRVRSEAMAERLASAHLGAGAGATTTVEARQGPLMPSRDIHRGCGFDVVVSTGDDMEVQCALDEACRAVGVAFVFAHAPGLFAFTFVDLGDEHLVRIGGKQGREGC